MTPYPSIEMNSTAFGNDAIVAPRLWDLIPGARAVTWLTS